MPTITINIDQYNAMQEKIASLEENNFSLRKKLGEKEEYIELLEDAVDIVHEANWYDRVFKWRQIKSLVEDVLKPLTESVEDDETV